MLLILSKPPIHAQYESLLEVIHEAARKEKVGILHLQDACITTTLPEYCSKAASNGVNLYVLKEDCQARGLLKKVSANVKIVDYEGGIELIMNEYKRIVT
ncbi:sulfurtransferase complex subunit TusB [Candidatus Bathyarchaeota archaeon]|nr:sulfurtransferase complex subunit TusB [Candidatus Bathyarchaeota archaeon]NIV44487.1 sulfurtransferase complex subunit TusB [Candidatus Bathyarchaeota archaeon]